MVKFRMNILRVGISSMMTATLIAINFTQVTWADSSGSQPVLSEFKVTTNDGQFFTIYNPSATESINLNSYELEYFNNYDVSKATSSKLIPLGGTLAPQASFMLSDGAVTICYQLTVDAVSLGFSTTSGFVELLQIPSGGAPGTLVMPNVVDYVGWSKSTSKGVDTVNIFPASQTTAIASGTSVTWLRTQLGQGNGMGGWQAVQPDPTNICSLQTIVPANSSGSPQTVGVTANQLGIGQAPPATIISLASSTSGVSAPSLPSGDVGLNAPQLTELLPNPTGTGNDATDEFIELYNPNQTAFDLSGFMLQTGVTTKHTYVFPAGTSMGLQSFTAFYSSVTGLSLSNTSGQATLLDPFGNVLSRTDTYGTAKDGQAWALANGKWYFTSQPTPSAANVVKQITTASKTSSKKTSSKANSAVKGASTTAGTAGTNGAETATHVATHPYVLAAAGALAVGYGVYEYRTDIANRYHQFRADRTDRRKNRSSFARRRSDRAGE